MKFEIRVDLHGSQVAEFYSKISVSIQLSEMPPN